MVWNTCNKLNERGFLSTVKFFKNLPKPYNYFTAASEILVLCVFSKVINYLNE